jgi:hypothetical protein
MSTGRAEGDLGAQEDALAALGRVEAVVDYQVKLLFAWSTDPGLVRLDNLVPCS